MEHPASQNQYDITSQMDFIVPLKQVGLVTRAVLESITLFYRPRRIIVVSAKLEGEILSILLPYWDVGKVEFVEEETFFLKNFNLTLEDILCQYDVTREGDQREPGWWLQQLIKLGASSQIPNVSENYVVWDGDLIPTRRWKLCDIDMFGNVKHYIAILQGEARSEFNTTQYSQCMNELLGYGTMDPETGGTFVAHHMVFNKAYVAEMLKQMSEKASNPLVPWPILIMSQSRKFYRFSEYKTYSTFMLRNHPSSFHYHELKHFGVGGLRFREASIIVEKILKEYPLTDGGLSYVQVNGFVNKNWKVLSKSVSPPAYVQLDHVYGLTGVDLKLTTMKYMGQSSKLELPCSSIVVKPKLSIDDTTSDECSTVVSLESELASSSSNDHSEISNHLLMVEEL